MYCSRGQSIFFPDKINIKKVPNPLFPRGTQKLSIRRHNFFTNPLHILHIYKQATEYICQKASQQATEHCFLNSEMPKKIHKSTERRPCVSKYQSAVLSTIADPLKLALLPEPASRARDAQKVAQYVFPL